MTRNTEELRRVSTLFLTVPAMLFAGLTLFLSLIYAERGLIALSLLVLGLGGGLRVWGRFSFHGVECSRELGNRRIFAGEELTFVLAAENRKLMPIWLELHAPVCEAGESPADEMDVTVKGTLLWHQGIRAERSLGVLTRGVYEIGPICATSADLPGFFPRKEMIGDSSEIIVFPRLVDPGPLSFPRRDLFGAAGAQSAIKDPLYISGTADYRHGTPSRYIHWKASARHHRLQEKVFESSQHEKALIVIDVAGYENERDSFERLLEVAASIVVQLDRRGAAVGFLTNGKRNGESPSFLRVARNGGRLAAILEILARLSNQPEGDGGDFLNRGLPLPWGLTCLYFAFQKNLLVQRALESFRRRNIPVRFITQGDVSRQEVDFSSTSGETLFEGGPFRREARAP
ncbi:MAG TPA: DUF58 domain-containing protein [Syntrophorhabdaceae bacterium]|jgi:uncharacterized protein (DUF58 family)